MASTRTPIDVRKQKTVVEYCRGDWLLMLDSGDVHICGTPKQALDYIRQAAKRGNKDATVTMIEWRNTPEGFKAPA